MARELRWTIPFKSLDDKQCTVNIYVEGWSGSVTQLTPAATPFVFEEDDTDSLLDVIRVKTGFLRVVELEYGDMTAMHPLTNTSHYITVSYGSTTVFTGFLQAQSFDSRMEPGPRVVELPVMSPLGTLGGKDMPIPASPSYITLAAALKQAATAMDSNIRQIVFPDYMLSATSRVLDLRINTLSLCPFNSEYSMVNNDTEPLYKPKSVGEFIEDLCNCFGMIVHDMPGMLVFTRYDYNGTYNLYDVSTMDAASPTYTQPTSGAVTQDLSGLQPKSDDNMESTVMPVSALTINYDSEIFPDYELPYNRCKVSNPSIGKAIMRPSTDEIASSYLLTSAIPTPGTAGVTIGAFGDQTDAYAEMEEMVLFTIPTRLGASAQFLKWKLYQVPKYFGYGCMLSFQMIKVINTQTFETERAPEGMTIGLILKNGNYYRQANGTWSRTSGQYIAEHTTDENGEIRIEYHQMMPDVTSPLEVIFCAGGFIGDYLYAIKGIKFNRTDYTYYQYMGGTFSDRYSAKDSNGSTLTAELAQTITVARPSEDSLNTSEAGTVGPYTLACSYVYMFQTQHRLTFDTYVLPGLTHYLNKITIGNSITKRIVGISFDLWNDIVTLTAQGGATLDN